MRTPLIGVALGITLLGSFAVGLPAAASTTLGVAASSSSSAPSFAATRNYRVGRFPEAVAIGDLNGDRKPDLAVATTPRSERLGAHEPRRRQLPGRPELRNRKRGATCPARSQLGTSRATANLTSR